MYFNSEILLSWKLCAYSHQNLFFFHRTLRESSKPHDHLDNDYISHHASQPNI